MDSLYLVDGLSRAEIRVVGSALYLANVPVSLSETLIEVRKHRQGSHPANPDTVDNEAKVNNKFKVSIIHYKRYPWVLPNFYSTFKKRKRKTCQVVLNVFDTLTRMCLCLRCNSRRFGYDYHPFIDV